MVNLKYSQFDLNAVSLEMRRDDFVDLLVILGMVERDAPAAAPIRRWIARLNPSAAAALSALREPGEEG